MSQNPVLLSRIDVYQRVNREAGDFEKIYACCHKAFHILYIFFLSQIIQTISLFYRFSFIHSLHFFGVSFGLQVTSQRLGVVAAPTTVPAGYSLPNSHCRFCGATAAITPNRQLCAGIFVRRYKSVKPCNACNVFIFGSIIRRFLTKDLPLAWYRKSQSTSYRLHLM